MLAALSRRHSGQPRAPTPPQRLLVLVLILFLSTPRLDFLHTTRRDGSLSSSLSPFLTFAEAAVKREELPRCIRLDQMRINAAIYRNYREFGIKDDEAVFCGVDAPAAVRCRCDIIEGCTEQKDPYGRSIGKCGCCGPWTMAVIVFFAVGVVVIIPAAMCLNTNPRRLQHFWLWAYPRRVSFGYVKLSQPPASPAGMPFSRSVFTVYRPENFVDLTAENADLEQSTSQYPAVEATVLQRGMAAASAARESRVAWQNSGSHDAAAAPPAPPTSTPPSPSAAITRRTATAAAVARRSAFRGNANQQAALLPQDRPLGGPVSVTMAQNPLLAGRMPDAARHANVSSGAGTDTHRNASRGGGARPASPLPPPAPATSDSRFVRRWIGD